MAINSKIILCKDINLDKQYKNVLNYTESQMVTLCQSKAIASANDYSFVRTSPNRVYVDFNYNLCLQANYIAFQNPRYSNKWFFAFIDEVIYKSDKSTEIRFTVDAWSTWFDKLIQNPCYVIRQHVNDDTVGANTIPEDIDVGDLITDFTIEETSHTSNQGWYWVICACNYDPDNNIRYSECSLVGNYVQGCTWFAFLIKPLENSQNNGISVLNDWLQLLDRKSHSDDMQAMFVLPYNLLPPGTVETTHKVSNNPSVLRKTTEFEKSSIRVFNDYQAKNNKLYTYPYSFLRVTNNMGSFNDYKIEDFMSEDDKVKFDFIVLQCLGCSGKLRPIDYKGVPYNDDESLTLGKYPVLSWSSDAYTNWLSQNCYNIAVEGINLHASNMLNTVGTAMNVSSNPENINFGNLATQSVSQTLSEASFVAKTIGSIRSAKMLPNTAKGNVNSGDLSFLLLNLDFKYMHMRPKVEYLQIIDDYFTRFGYKINRVTTPNITGRKYWNYIEIGAGEEIGKGEVPVNYMETINNACQKGVTIWHNHDNIGNFSLLNTII